MLLGSVLATADDHDHRRAILQPKPKPQSESERDFLVLGEGAEIWLTTAAASGVPRIRSKMGRATELAVLFGKARVDEALRRAAQAGRFGENDLASILGNFERDRKPLVVADEHYSAQRGTKAWEVIGR
jgi:hypothetical protein